MMRAWVPGRALRALCAKAWSESRGRFVVSAVVIAGLCAALLVFQTMFRARMLEIGGRDAGYTAYAYARIYGGVVRSIFLILAILLGLGGLARERSHGTIGFTLALPV